jgi:enamine deaminase RidA (YjgF/YER057c/UK114 family)
VVIAEAPARHRCTAGQGGENARGELSPDFAQQVEQALRNLATVLDAVQAAPSDVVKSTVRVVDQTQDRLDVFVQTLRAM